MKFAVPAGDRPWLAVMAACVAAEFVWWATAWSAGIAPPPFVGTYLLLSVAALGGAIGLRLAAKRSLKPLHWRAALAGTLLVALGASLFLPLKYAIPAENFFWLDRPLAAAERATLGVQPWVLLDRLLGWAAVPIDRIYGLWLMVQSLVLFSIMLAAPSAAKTRALIAYSLAWFLLGVVAALLFSSAGPIFYDRLFEAGEFAGLRETLSHRGAWMVLAESDAMWRSYVSGLPTLVAGMSAVPSIHVAISLWIALAARDLAPRAAPFGFAYAAFIWIASVQLGWHYAFDGLAGALGMAAIWNLAGRIPPSLGVRSEAVPSAEP